MIQQNVNNNLKQAMVYIFEYILLIKVWQLFCARLFKFCTRQSRSSPPTLLKAQNYASLGSDYLTICPTTQSFWPSSSRASVEGPACNAHHLCSAGLTGKVTDDGSDCRAVWPSSHLMQAVELVRLWQPPCQAVSHCLLPPNLSIHCFCAVVVFLSAHCWFSAWFWREAVNAVRMVWDRTSLSNFSRPRGEALFCQGVGGWGWLGGEGVCGFYFERQGANELTEAVVPSAARSMWNSPCFSLAWETKQKTSQRPVW